MQNLNHKPSLAEFKINPCLFCPSLDLHYLRATIQDNGMIELTQEELKERLSDKIFHQISETADELGVECYVVGGYVRDIFLERPSKDIDVVVVGHHPFCAKFFQKGSDF